MADATDPPPQKPRWMNPKEDASFAEMLLKSFANAKAAPQNDPTVIALAIVQARAEGDEESAKKLEAMLPASTGAGTSE